MIDFDGTLNAAISAALGDELPLVYFPQTGGAVPIQGIFTLITDRVFDENGEPDGNVMVATLGLQVSQLERTPLQSDLVRVGDVTYAVNDVSIDGLGWAYLKMNLAA